MTGESFHPRVAYAKNAAHDGFLLNFKGELRGRSFVNFLAGIEILGGAQLRQKIESELALPAFRLDEMYPARQGILIWDRAVRAGIDMRRIGELALPAFKRSNPAAFEGKTVADAFVILELHYRTQTSWGGVTPAPLIGRGQATVFRRDAPGPCEYFEGVVQGLLKVFGVAGGCQEAACQWAGARACRFEVRWHERLSSL